MDNFMFHNPTKLIFGRDTLQSLKAEIPQYGSRVLVTYGGGSIKRNGIYDQAMKLLAEMDAQVFELSGIEPNPRLSSVHKGIALCKEEKIDFILAIGGGSVIDATKAIAAGARYEGDIWEIITKKETAKQALPFGTVLTLAATGSEMNAGSVITNWETQEKIGWGAPCVYPQFSILDPSHTFSVPKDQTIYGIVDMMSHALEHYFSGSPHTPYNERMVEGLLTTVMETAPHALANLEDYESRETLLFCGTMALNGVINQGMNGDWATHSIEHAVSAVYDIPHGGGLAIIFPNWIRYNLDVTEAKMKQLAIRVFGVDPASKTDREIAEEGIDRLRQFWSEIGAPSRLADYDIDDKHLTEMAEKAAPSGKVGRFASCSTEDVEKILTMCL
ncbi:iron-containing alcohol dehydrogenase [Hazenella sp. IB182357]|uniref:Iron-containing alcohol dehydrogenase n=1 Tax=Polycladospora coralii TaxID=2771432 RepID=A0A926RYX6_9BACL|nr:iron-containing alcohol dehydrogenase [Polycladospora coralii]MBD1373921.1 iron-containing alcohol dehydrogenase [Polycladospora coralii]MBS7531043.1 iron-containing alcohol dehydrogenase [Polycladospora coralii]